MDAPPSPSTTQARARAGSWPSGKDTYGMGEHLLSKASGQAPTAIIGGPRRRRVEAHVEMAIPT